MEYLRITSISFSFVMLWSLTANKKFNLMLFCCWLIHWHQGWRASCYPSKPNVRPWIHGLLWTDRKARGTNPDPPGGTKGLEKYTHFNSWITSIFSKECTQLELTLPQNNEELNHISIFKTRRKVTTVINLIICINQSIIQN